MGDEYRVRRATIDGERFSFREGNLIIEQGGWRAMLVGRGTVPRMTWPNLVLGVELVLTGGKRLVGKGSITSQQVDQAADTVTVIESSDGAFEIDS